MDGQIKSQRVLAFIDLVHGLKQWQLWVALGLQDIKMRYRRSKLGPLWLTISMAITIYTMGFLYGHLFKVNLSVYYPHLAASMIVWALISNMIIELAEAYPLAEGFAKQFKLPYTLYIHRILWRNFIIFFHNIVVFIPILIIFHESIHLNLNTFWLVPGLIILYLSAFFYGLVLAIICARYRDCAQIIKSLVQVIFFLTPVMWMKSTLPPHYAIYVNANPFSAYLDLISQPLMGQMPGHLSLGYTFLCLLVGIGLASLFFIRYRRRIIYWL